MWEKAHVAKINNTIGKIMYFLNTMIGDTNHELLSSAMEMPRNVKDSMCNFVLLSNQVNRIFSVAQMSALIHAMYNNKSCSCNCSIFICNYAGILE